MDLVSQPRLLSISAWSSTAPLQLEKSPLKTQKYPVGVLFLFLKTGLVVQPYVRVVSSLAPALLHRFASTTESTIVTVTEEKKENPDEMFFTKSTNHKEV